LSAVLVFSHEGIKETIICKQIVIATGSRPYHPQGLDFDHDRKNVYAYQPVVELLCVHYAKPVSW
jgi:pyruvate/2-oxoglutarate dehydrogenase complex dihydrolipoamide dehydrogenase (E3) component